jgi:hypothetical protein
MRPPSVYANPPAPAACPCDLLRLPHGRAGVGALKAWLANSPTSTIQALGSPNSDPPAPGLSAGWAGLTPTRQRQGPWRGRVAQAQGEVRAVVHTPRR